MPTLIFWGAGENEPMIVKMSSGEEVVIPYDNAVQEGISFIAHATGETPLEVIKRFTYGYGPLQIDNDSIERITSCKF